MIPEPWIAPVGIVTAVFAVPLIVLAVRLVNYCWLLWRLSEEQVDQKADQEAAWSRGKHVTFMEPEPQLNSRVKAVDSKPICESLTRYGCKIPNCKEPHYAEVEIRRALDKRQYQYP